MANLRYEIGSDDATSDASVAKVDMAIELVSVRVDLIVPGLVDTPLSAQLLGDELENRRNQLRATLPIRRVVGPAGGRGERT